MMAVTLSLALYPTFADGLSNVKQGQQITSLEDNLKNLSSEQVAAEKERAREYNEKIREYQKTHTFGYTETGQSDEEYNSILNVDGNGIMGIVEIPSINVLLPIAHGTSETVLAFEAGHMYGSSLIVGGESTHSVVAAHTGLANAKLFSDVKKMQTGDVFYIHVLNEIREYTVIQKVVVPQGDEELPYLQIVDGKDYCTLYTCSPYGVNDHRILVRGEFTGLVDGAGTGGEDYSEILNRRALLKVIGMLLIPIILIIIGIIRARRAKKIRKEMDAEKAARKAQIASETAEAGEGQRPPT